ncbi:MBL fold metallo-hydrolase [uncultured Shimia sp.]|uniref:MBL fold metallo-hydrolase n=1 Tax=uncultured Shimia sp. TaxID=573152 RepID=UPI00261085D9|nr:MBL fold metallo-hydrolase [uncultured Shimia sp.]
MSDGHLVLPMDFAIGPAPREEAAQILAKHGVTGANVQPSCNISVFQDGTNTVLFDVGSGPDFMPSAGALLDNLDTIGLTPEDVTHVLVTHAHPDHIWGLLDDFDEPVFAQAKHMIGRREWDYWWDPETVNSIGEQRMAFAAGARRRFEMMEDVFERFDAGEEVVSGIQAVATYGHTPGHMSFEVRSGGEATLIIGDAIANHHLAFDRPDWPSGSDQDADLGVHTRRALFDRIISDQISVVGFHFPGTGFGNVEKSGDGFVFLEASQ